MNIKVNGEAVEIESDGLVVTELLKQQKVDMPEMVSVEHNGTILDRAAFETTQVKDGDQVEFLYFMGGGSPLRAN
ncbi:MAG: thiamine biosynthesis protein ThiS [Actinobacteria bacterium]|nr:thiamine biosynthesis protein ThiS [Actinomycetota bacterium]